MDTVPGVATTMMQTAQAEVRRIYVGGSIGQVYAGLAWLASAAVWWLVGPTPAIAVLLVTGFFLYPVTTGVSRLLGSPGSIPPSNPLRPLGLTAPIAGALGLPVALAASLQREEWFFPAMMIVMGAHYLPFWPLYGMWLFVPLGAGMWVTGVVVALWLPSLAVSAAALTGLALVGVGVVAWVRHARS